MDSALHNHSEVRADIYHALATALSKPTRTLPDDLLAVARTGAVVLRSGACADAAEALSRLLPVTFHALRREFAATLYPTDRRPPALYESMHRHGRLMGPVTRAVEDWYTSLGIHVADSELPDHAGTEMAFMGMLIAARDEQQQRNEPTLAAWIGAEHARFMRKHGADWLPQLGKSLAETGTPFYAAVGQWLSGFLSEEINRGRATRKRRAYLPQIQKPSACSFCTACIASCPTTALAIVENADETQLVVSSYRCNGCGRCRRECPVDCLQLVAADSERTGDPAARETPQILARSQRVRCPQCGQPTVSRAEQDQVLSRLDADAHLRRQLSLCVDCKQSTQSGRPVYFSQSVIADGEAI